MKVLLVDDNYQMLEFIHDCIPWAEKGLEVIGLCENGVEALELAKKNMPEIVLTDIDMPHMNGLQLIEEIEKLNPDIQSLIISCHDDFQYAQKALKLLVNDYIIKETIEAESLMEAIDKVIAKIKVKKSLVEQNRTMLKKQWLRALVDGPINIEAEWVSRSRTFNIDLETKSYIPVIGYVRNINSTLERFKSADLIMYKIDEMAQENNMEGFIYDNFQMLWFFQDSNCIKENIYEYIRDSLSELQETLNKNCGIKVAFIYSKPVATIHEFQQSIQKMIQIKHEWFYIEDESVFALENMKSSFSTENIFSQFPTVVDDLKKLVYEEEDSTIEQTVNNWIELLKENKYHPEMIKSWLNNILVMIQLNNNFVNYKNQYNDLFHNEINSIDNIQQLREYVCQYIRGVIDYVKSEGKSERQEIWEAKKYVETHINERITMESVAQHLFMNPSHFSRIFKKETNETFIEYVTKLKMKKAVDYLKNTNSTVEEISYKLGYENTSYFIKLFKKTNLLSPLEYRKAN
ncbi:response regulator transcription factor [Alkalihalobacillus sp. 1P02AB]|uniref:response regulator transcription factor n=1 Tax=Alkalihalobacillus sp. 1P02AB TaxID=3132260 RepID=UPI0039A4858D